MSRRCLIAIALLVVVIVVCPARAAIPGADKPDAYTERTYRNDQLEYNLRTLVEAYKQVGARNPKWDDKAITFLQGMARRLTFAGASGIYRVTDVPSLVTLEQQGREVINAGCEDPLILDMFSITLLDQRKTQESTPLVRKAAERLLTSHYPVQRAANSIRRAGRTLDAREANLRPRYDQMLYDADLATARFADVQGVERRIIFKTLEPDIRAWPDERQGQFYTALKESKGDPWITNIIGGRYHITAAWAARGTGYANTVTQQGWKKMSEELALARDCLLEAYRLEPKCPEAAAMMISVVMGGVAGPGETLRTWFDRAVQAQLDYDEAYSSYRYALLPRWHGNYPTLFEFAQECADTNRFDTDVPFYYLTTLDYICNDMNGDRAAWRAPGVIERAGEILSKYAQTHPDGDNPQFFDSEIIGYAWQVGRYDIGRAALDKLQGDYSRRAVEVGMVIPTRTVSGTYAMTGPWAERLKEAEAEVAAGKFDAAIAGYKQIQGDANSTLWIRGRTQELIWQLQFESGEWVNLMPGEDLAGWYAIDGNFTSHGNTLKGTTSATGARLICGAKFGARYELQAKIDLAPAGEPIQNTQAGLMFGWAGNNRFYSLFQESGTRRMTWHHDGVPDFVAARAGATPLPAFDIKMWDGRAGATIDEREAFSYRDLFDLARRTDNRIGIGSNSTAGNLKFKVTELRIRKLIREPQ